MVEHCWRYDTPGDSWQATETCEVMSRSCLWLSHQLRELRQNSAHANVPDNQSHCQKMAVLNSVADCTTLVHCLFAKTATCCKRKKENYAKNGSLALVSKPMTKQRSQCWHGWCWFQVIYLQNILNLQSSLRYRGQTIAIVITPPQYIHWAGVACIASPMTYMLNYYVKR